MKAEAPSDNRGPVTTTRFRLTMFVVAELLCTGAFVAAVVLYM
jgi:hypothetical protein